MIAVVVCRLTKMAHFIPCATTLTAGGCAELLRQNVFRYDGIPSELVSDRDPRFTSYFWAGLLKMLDVTSLKSTANHPQTDRQTERVNGSLINILRCYLDKEVHEDRTWLAGLIEAEMVYNGSTHTKTGCSPYYLNYGYEPVLPHEDPTWVVEGTVDEDAKAFATAMKDTLRRAAEVMSKQQAVMEKTANRKRLAGPVWRKGDFVLLEAEGISHVPQGKLAPYFVGPLQVARVLPSGNTYELRLPPSWSRMHNAFHESVLRPYNGEPQRDEQEGSDSVLLGGQSPCAADADEVGLCAATLRKIAKCGYCVVCHKDAMRTYGLPMRCTSHADHRVDLPSDFVPRPQPEPRQQAQPEEEDEQPAAQRGGEEAAVMAEVMASSPPPGPPPPPLDEGDDEAIAGHQRSLREARYERRLQAKEG